MQSNQRYTQPQKSYNVTENNINNDEYLRKYFSVDHKSVYCNGIKGLITTMGIYYNSSEWKLLDILNIICGDLKMITILLGMQNIHSIADNRDYAQNVWPIRENMDPGEHNMMKEQLIDRSNILLPPSHIKLGLIKRLIKTLDKEQKYITISKN